jgi:hypothetical protein
MNHQKTHNGGIMKSRYSVIALCLMTLLCAAEASAQEKQLNVRYGQAQEGQPFEVRIEPPQNVQITRAVVRFKVFGSSDFRDVEAQPVGNSLSAVIQGKDVEIPSIEFFVVAVLTDNSRLTFPAVSPETNPVSVTVRPKPEDDNVIAVSPLRDEVVLDDEAVISFSFYRVSNRVDKSKTDLFVNGVNVTARAMFSDNLVSYVPERNLPVGVNRSTIIVRDSKGDLIGTTTTYFKVTSRNDVGKPTVEAGQPVRLSSQSSVEFRSERIADSTINYARLNLNVDGNWQWLNFGAQVYITNEDPVFRSNTDPASRRQSANRFVGYVKTPYVDVRAGDVFPDYSYYLSNGVRVRGVEINAHPGPIRALVTTGTSANGYDALFRSGTGADTTIQFDILNTQSLADRARITNELNARGLVRTDSIGLGGSRAQERFQFRQAFGAFQRDYFTALAGLNSQLVKFELQYMRISERNGLSGLNRVNILSRGVAPQENAALGATFRVSPIANVLELFADAGFSLANRDVTDGSISSAQLDALTGSTGVADALNKIPLIGSYQNLTNIITVNTSFFPLLPLDLSSLAWRVGGSFNYAGSSFGNFLRAEFIRQGANFQSFGLAFYQPDVQGIRLSDRLRVLDSRLVVSLGYENLADNLLKQRDRRLRVGGTIDGTTNRSIIRAGVSAFPGAGLPSGRIEFQLQGNKNAFGETYRDSTGIGATGGVANISGVSLQNDNTTSTITFDIQHALDLSSQSNLSLGLTTVFANRTDNRNFGRFAAIQGIILDSAYRVFDNILYSQSDLLQVTQDFSSRSLILSGNLTLGRFLSAGLSVSNQQSKFAVLDTARGANNQPTSPVRLVSLSREQVFNSLDASATYGFLENTLRATVRAGLTFGDFQRTLAGLGVLYDITPSMQLSGDLSLFFNNGAVVNGLTIKSSTDVIASVRYQIVFGN